MPDGAIIRPHEDPPAGLGCAIDTNTHPRWDKSGSNYIYGRDWFGFKALPGGGRYANGSFYHLGVYGSWWSSTEYTSTRAWTRSMNRNNGYVRHVIYPKTYGFSLRCVRDPSGEIEFNHPDGELYQSDYEDGSENRYDSVKIGDQIWTMKNLITTKYQNGNNITTGLSDGDWSQATSGAYTIYPHANVDGIASEQAMIDAYGILYNWYAVDNGLVDNNGYRVPTDDDWSELKDYLILQYDIHFSNVAVVLKSCRQVNHPLA